MPNILESGDCGKSRQSSDQLPAADTSAIQSAETLAQVIDMANSAAVPGAADKIDRVSPPERGRTPGS